MTQTLQNEVASASRKATAACVEAHRIGGRAFMRDMTIPARLNDLSVTVPPSEVARLDIRVRSASAAFEEGSRLCHNACAQTRVAIGSLDYNHATELYEKAIDRYQVAIGLFDSVEAELNRIEEAVYRDWGVTPDPVTSPNPADVVIKSLAPVLALMAMLDSVDPDAELVFLF